MARGPFQGTFQPNARATIATAPDALVYINGETDTIGCPQCSRTFNLNKYITSIQTDLGIDSAPGSASISLSVPRHAIDDFYFDGNPVITTMMEVEIYAKGYYLVEGLPQYYPIFWGIITEVADNYSGGEHTVSIHAADILKWWELNRININPSHTAPAGQLGKALFGQVLDGKNPYDVIFTLANSTFGDVMVGTGSSKNLVREATDPQTFVASLTDMMLYWEKRFAKMRSNLVLYGTNGVAVRGSTVDQKYSGSEFGASTAIRDAMGEAHGGQFTFDPASENVVAFKRNVGNATAGEFRQSEYQTKLELANMAKESIGFEFFMDVTGDIVFKPPFYNLDVLSNKPTSWVQDIDVISWDFSESESEVVTQIIMQGGFHSKLDLGDLAEVTAFTTITDYHLLRKYGWRSQPYNAEFCTDPISLFCHGLDVLDRINSKRHRANVTIPMRPELRLGFPIYLAPKDQIWYLSGISHSIQFGGQATTTLQLTGKRSKFIAPRGIGDLKLQSFADKPVASTNGAPKSFYYSTRQLQQSAEFTLDIGNAATLPANAAAAKATSAEANPASPLILRHPKTGRIVGYPNMVMAYTRPFSQTDVEKYANGQADEKRAVQGNPLTPKEVRVLAAQNRQIAAEDLGKRFGATKDAAMVGKHVHGAYQYGLNSAGVFVYAHDSSPGGGVIRELLVLPTSRLKVTPTPEVDASLANPHALIRPISDERGFELIGHYQYGRRVSLRDGRLITNSPGAAAKIDLQVALAGDLSATLMAQSQGLTTVVTGYDNPAVTLATMTDDERQTAAVINPSTKRAEFTSVGDNFVGAPTKDSPVIQPSIEATQLSRALTLAEMSVKDSTAVMNEDCVCVTGRADLAFMSSDYQVKVLTGAATQDPSALLSSADLSARGGPIQVSPTQVAQDRVAALDEKIAAVKAYIQSQERSTSYLRQQAADDDDPGATAPDAAVSMLMDDYKALEALEVERDKAKVYLDEQRSQYGSSNSILTNTPSEMTSRVEQFLIKLYETLDGAHQDHEKQLRGDRLPTTNLKSGDLHTPGKPVRERGQNPNVPEPAPQSEFAPPFSAPNRFQLGDPNAAVGSAQSNVEGLTAAWKGFSAQLKENTQKRDLITKISQDKASIERVTASRDQLIKQRDARATVVVGVDLQKQIDAMTNEIAKLTEAVASNEMTLGGTK